MRFHTTWLILAVAGQAVAGPSAEDVRDNVRAYRQQHEPAIVSEFAQLLAIPNHASDTANISKNADLIARALRERKVETRLLELEGAPPVVFGKLDAPGATRTVTFYAHYDGQPTRQSGWTAEPFQPTLRRQDGSVIDLRSLPQRLDPESRLFARSASDDKAPIIAILTALDALRASRWQPNVNLRFFFEGEEEAGSPHLAAFLKTYQAELKTDLWVICDGPVHQDGSKLVYFGVRGATALDITVYGPNRGLHSGHYGNWAPNPIVLLTHLLDSMRDTQARILIPGFYDDVRAPTSAELKAAREMPDYDAQIKRNLGLARTEGEPASLQTQLMLPALNVRGIAGSAVGEAAANVISPEATASIDFRLVPNQTPDGVRRRVEQHVERQGYFIVRQPPDEATRLAHAKIALLAWDNEGSYPAARTALDNPMAQHVARVVEQVAGARIVVAPSLGGSVPMYLFQGDANTPVIGVPLANFDNNQHAANENLRLQNLWDAIEIFAGLFTWGPEGAGDLRLQPCRDQKLQPAKCGTYTVWENRAAKAGRTIDLNVVVLQATGPQRKPDPLFILLGGPGEAAASAGPEWYLDDPTRASRDLVFVDARGTGESNGLHCRVPKDAPLQAFMPTLDAAMIQACRPKLEQHADLRYYLTTYAMDDLDDLRTALGYDKINLDAGSYGTGAALVYIRQHGDHVRAATLWGATALSQPMPLLAAPDAEHALRNVFRDCYAEAACKAAFPTLEADYKRAVERIESGPVRLTVKDPRNDKPTDVTLDADAFAESLRAMLYKPESMRSIPLLLHKAAAGDYKTFADHQLSRNISLGEAIADGLYFSITCTEDIDRSDPQQVHANNRGTFLADHRSRPHTAGCKDWPRGQLPPGFGEEVKSDVPVLMINGNNDPATPPSAGRAAMSRLSNARLIVVPFGGHSSEGLIGEQCVKTIAARFLDTADQRSLDTTCLKDVKHQPFILN